MAAPQSKNLAAIIDPRQAGELLRAIEGYAGQRTTRLALQLAPHVFVRPGELRKAAWSEIDFEAAVWRIPAGRMKMRREHVVPLSAQALGILRNAQHLTGTGRFIFPSQWSPTKPMSENAVNGALRRLGYSGQRTSHGFRAIASTLLDESRKWSPDAIERALAHKDTDNIRAAYHRGTHWNERVQMGQWRSDYLDTLKRGADVLPFRSAQT